MKHIKYSDKEEKSSIEETLKELEEGDPLPESLSGQSGVPYSEVDVERVVESLQRRAWKSRFGSSSEREHYLRTYNIVLERTDPWLVLLAVRELGRRRDFDTLEFMKNNLEWASESIAVVVGDTIRDVLYGDILRESSSTETRL